MYKIFIRNFNLIEIFISFIVNGVDELSMVQWHWVKMWSLYIGAWNTAQLPVKALDDNESIRIQNT